MEERSAKQVLEDFRQQRLFAVVGASPKKEKFGHWVFHSLREQRYVVVPINPNYATLEGVKCYASMRDLQVCPDVVFIVVRPEETMSVLHDCVACGVKRVFFQQGSESRQAIDFCDANGITAMYGACVIQYFAPHGYHRLHTWLGNLLSMKPKINAPRMQSEIPQ